MSCQLATIANIQDVLSIKKYLFPELIQEEKKFEPMDDGWKDSEWNWDMDEENKDLLTSQSSTLTSSWLEGVSLSMSPTGDLMVFAYGEKIVYLAQKWDLRVEDVQTKYSVVYEGSPIHQPGETITSVLCLPLASQKRSLEGCPDWTCVMVGFSTGYVRIYTENGTLLLNQIFCEDAVVQLKCTTYSPPRNNREGERAEEICILYSQSLVLIDGFSFYQSLKACKNQAARAAATGDILVDPPLLSYKKWGFNDQEVSSDVVPCGYVQPTIFDQMLSDSISKGPNTNIRTSLYGSHLYLNVGRGPCINFYHTVQTSVQPQLSDVTKVVAHKLKTAFLSAASGWLGIGGSGGNEMKDKKLKIEPDVPLIARFGLYDKRRVGEQVALSPDFKMAATTDSFGRVLLLDAVRGVAVRMWKGYRDAQVGWIESVETQVDDDSNEGPSKHSKRTRRFCTDEEERARSTDLRRTCFLVIYAPRRGILEVWSAQSGPRVAAFNVSRTARLIHSSHGMLGLNNANISKSAHPNSETARNRFDGLFFVDIDGTIKNLSVPFHLVFSGKNSKRTRDAHLLKQLVVLLKENKMESASLKTDIMSLYKDIKTCFSQRQFMEKVLSTKYLKSSTLKELLECAVKLSTKSNEGRDPEQASLSRWLTFKTSVLDLYDNMAELPRHHGDRCRDDSQENTKESLIEILVSQLKLEEHEATCLADVLLRRLAINELTSSSQANQKSVTFQDEIMTPEEFLCCFEFRRKMSEGSDRPTRSKKIGSSRNEGRINYDDDVGDYHQHHHGDELMEGTKVNNIIKDGHDDDDNDDDGGRSYGAEYEVSIVKNLSDAKLNNLGEFIFELLTSGNTSTLDKLKILLVEGPLNCENLLNLLVKYSLSMDFTSLKIIGPLMHLISALLVDIANKRSDHSISDYLLDGYATQCSQSENIFSALILILIGRCLSCQQNSPENDHNVSELNPSWEEVTMTKEKWSQTTRQYQDILVVDNLLKAQEFKSVVPQDGSKPVRISLERIVQNGRGTIPETIGKFICSLNLPVGIFFLSSPPVVTATQNPRDRLPSDDSPTMETETVAMKSIVTSDSSTSISKECCDFDVDCLNQISIGLEEVRKHLPLTASTSVMLANSCWEFVANWNRDSEVTRSLDLALEYLNRMEDNTLQCGLAKMIWEMFLVKRLSSAVLLTAKVGKAPKDRLIRKDVGLSEKSLASFISFSLDVLDVFIQDEDHSLSTSSEAPPTNCSMDESQDDTLLYDVEDAWLDYSRGRNSSILELATNQTPADSLTVLHHRTLCMAMKAIVTFSLKSVKLFSLYDSKGKNAFFKPLHQSGISSIDVPDESVKAARVNFLERIIASSVCLLGDASALDFQYDIPSLTRGSGFKTWHELITRLTQLFVVDPDFTIVQFAHQLLLSGFDAIAIEVLLPVNDRNEAGKFLMPVLGARLQSVVMCRDAKLQARRTCISSTCFTNWLKMADPKILRCTNVPLPWTAALAKLLTKLINEDQPDFSLAREAFDLIPNFE